ncbi:MAG: type IX secretion system membrane protein PorP/SprF [Bacteroidota bacterium]
MRKLIPILLLFFSFSFLSHAQQDGMFTKYMFNTLSYNPAYAGSKEYMSLVAIYRDQWWGMEGSPHTQTISFHTPFKERIGLGFNISNDKIGVSGSTIGSLSYAYRVPFGEGKVSLGLQATFMNYRADFDRLTYKDPRVQDESFNGNDANIFAPNFGAGIFYYSEKFYAGFSVPHLLNTDLRNDVITTNRWAQLYRHYYFTMGVAIPIRGEDLVFKPSLLIKSVGLFGDFSTTSNNLKSVGAPNLFDIDLSLLFNQALWVGASFRSSFEAFIGRTSTVDSADLWAMIHLNRGLRVGLAYDFTLTELREYARGSFELMVGYDFNFQNKNIVTPRYF